MIYEARQVLLASARRACGFWDADGHDAAGTQPVDASAVVLIDSITEHTDNYATKRGPQPLPVL